MGQAVLAEQGDQQASSLGLGVNFCLDSCPRETAGKSRCPPGTYVSLGRVGTHVFLCSTGRIRLIVFPFPLLS